MKAARLACLAVGLLLVACSDLPKDNRAFALGPLRFGQTLVEVKQAFAAHALTLATYDTPLGQTWTVAQPFAAPFPAPAWLTEGVDQLALTFWDDRLVRARLHYPTADLARALDIKQRFDRAYRLTADLSKGERLFLEYDADAMKVFLSGGGDQNVAAAFVDQPAYEAMDVARRRMVTRAAESFALDGLRFGTPLGAAKQVLGANPARSTFFEGLEGWAWKRPAQHREWILGYAPALGLSAIARLYDERWPLDRVQEKLYELTRDFGQGQVTPTERGRTLQIDVDTLHVTLMLSDCTAQGCLVSEGWLWRGPNAP
jgi:hypothetical protein